MSTNNLPASKHDLSIYGIKRQLFMFGNIEIPKKYPEYCIEMLDDLVHIPHTVQTTERGNMLITLKGEVMDKCF